MRAHFRDYVLGNNGKGIPNASVRVEDLSTSELLSASLYSTATGSTTLTNPLTTRSDGSFEFYLDASARVQLRVSYGTHPDIVAVVDVGDPYDDELNPAYETSGSSAQAVADHVALDNPHSQYALASQLVHDHDDLYEPKGEVAAHEAAPDPHTQYVKTTDSLPYDPTGTASDAIAAHVAEADPHTQYLTSADIGGTVADHVLEADPHTQYLKESDANFEAFGAVSDHVALTDPHTQYVKKTDSIGVLADVDLSGISEGMSLKYLPDDTMFYADYDDVLAEWTSPHTVGLFFAGVLYNASSEETHYLTLPDANTCRGKRLTFKKTDASAHAVELQPVSGQTIDGAATVSLTAQYETIEIVSDGDNWVVISSKVESTDHSAVTLGAGNNSALALSGQELTLTLPADVGFANPMTSVGDLIVGGTSGAATRLAVGTDGQVPTAQADGTIAWETPSATGGSVATDTIFDAKGDLPVGTGPNTSARLPVGIDGYYLKANSAQATGLEWAAVSSTGGAPTDYPYLGFGTNSTLSAEVDVQSLSQVNEVMGWPPYVPDGTDLHAGNLWFRSVGTPTTAPTVVHVAGESGLTETYERAIKVVTDAAGEGFETLPWTYADQPRVKAGKHLSALVAIWAVGGVSVTAKLVNSDASETVAAAVSAAAWTLVEIPNHLLAGTTCKLQFTTDGAGTFYVAALSANLGPRGLMLGPRPTRWVSIGYARVVNGVDTQETYVDVDAAASTSPLAFRVEFGAQYRSTAHHGLIVRRNGFVGTDVYITSTLVANGYQAAYGQVHLDDGQTFEIKGNEAPANQEFVYIDLRGYEEYA
jgi:hypothetical protein